MHIGGIIMQNKTYAQYCKKSDLLENDIEYQAIMADFRVAEAEYLDLYQKLTPDQQEVLTELIGKLSELHLRETELLFTAQLPLGF